MTFGNDKNVILISRETCLNACAREIFDDICGWKFSNMYVKKFYNIFIKGNGIFL